MKTKIYNYLLEELYAPTCDNCQYSDINAKRVPCDKCDGSRHKLHKGYKAELKRMTREIIKIVKER